MTRPEVRGKGNDKEVSWDVGAIMTISEFVACLKKEFPEMGVDFGDLTLEVTEEGIFISRGD